MTPGAPGDRLPFLMMKHLQRASTLTEIRVTAQLCAVTCTISSVCS